MKYSRKMKLIDVDNIFSEQKADQSNEKSLSNLDKNMKRILDSKTISDEQKLKLYNFELQKYMFFLKQKRRPKEFRIMHDYDDDEKNEKTFDKKFQNTNNNEEHKDNNNSHLSTNNESDQSLSLDEEEDEPQMPKTSTPFKDHTKDSTFFSSLKTSLSKTPSLSPSSAKIFKIEKETDPFKPKKVLNRSQHLTRQLVASSSRAAQNLKNWISLSKK